MSNPRDGAEDGELSDSDQDDEDQSVYVKREGPESTSTESESVSRQYRNRQNREVSGSPESRRSSYYWRDQLRNEEENYWLREERMRRLRNNEGANRGGVGTSHHRANTPQARSTANRPRASNYEEYERFPRSDGARQIDFGNESSTNRQNISQFGQSKMFKVEPFPKGVEPTEQLQEWIYWRTNFEISSC